MQRHCAMVALWFVGSGVLHAVLASSGASSTRSAVSVGRPGDVRTQQQQPLSLTWAVQELNEHGTALPAWRRLSMLRGGSAGDGAADAEDDAHATSRGAASEVQGSSTLWLSIILRCPTATDALDLAVSKDLKVLTSHSPLT